MRAPETYRIVFKILPDGERLPLLVGPDGVPLWYPTLFATINYRNASRSPNTTEAALKTVRKIIQWANDRRQSLEDRFGRADFLTTGEIEGLASYLTTRQPDISTTAPASDQRASSKERARAVPRKQKVAVLSAAERYARLTYAAAYLRWLAICRVEEEAKQVDKLRFDHIAAMAQKLIARRPASRRSQIAPVFAASNEDESRFLEAAAKPMSTSTYSQRVAQRNGLITSMLHELGLRVGELLSIKVQDIDFQAQEIIIPRRHHDPEDTRLQQPTAKTLDRRLPLSDDLARKLQSYVLGCRKSYQEARRHPFLFISLRSSRQGQAGAPMSRAAVEKMFQGVCAKVSPHVRICPHLLRHGAATRMAFHLHQLGRSEAEMERSLNYIFGWADGSTTYMRYTKQFQHETAMQAQIDLQNSIKRRL